MDDGGRVLDTRDSVMQRQADANRKGRSFSHQGTAELSRTHVTPWGTNPDGSSPTMPAPASPTRQFNHFHNAEAPAPQGLYRVPDVSRSHNHAQNAETQQGTDRLKMTSSRINDGHIALGEAKPGDFSGTTSVLQAADQQGGSRLKVAPGCSRINEGNDIFGPAVPPPPSVGYKPRAEPFVDQPRTGHIRNPWMGYTDASRK